MPITRRGGGGGKVREVILGSRKDAINRCGSKKQNSLDNWPCKLCGRVRRGGWGGGRRLTSSVEEQQSENNESEMSDESRRRRINNRTH